MEMKKIRYRDLSGWLKVAFVFSMTNAGIFVVSFLVGFVQGLLYW